VLGVVRATGHIAPGDRINVEFPTSDSQQPLPAL
jgi:hypothetical protein